jgi:hypothetical protein
MSYTKKIAHVHEESVGAQIRRQFLRAYKANTTTKYYLLEVESEVISYLVYVR